MLSLHYWRAIITKNPWLFELTEDCQHLLALAFSNGTAIRMLCTLVAGVHFAETAFQTERFEELEPEHWAAEAVQSEVNRVMGVGDHVQTRPDELETPFRRHLAEVALHTDVNCDRSCGEQKNTISRYQQTGHRVRPLAVGGHSVLSAFPLQSYDLRDDGAVQREDDHERSERGQDEVQPTPDDVDEVSVFWLGHVADSADQRMRPEEVTVDDHQRESCDQHLDGGVLLGKYRSDAMWNVHGHQALEGD